MQINISLTEILTKQALIILTPPLQLQHFSFDV